MDVQRRIKHGLDRLVAVALLIALAPLLGLLALAIRLESPGSPLLLEERVGRSGRGFTVFKFRTARRGTGKHAPDAAAAGSGAPTTRVGRLVCALALERLPQLLNVALGEMSFVGPQPALRHEVDSTAPRQARRLRFRPGLTGWAQIHGPHPMPWARRLEYDLEYVDRCSLWFDLRILLYAASGRRRGGAVRTAPAHEPPRAAPASPGAEARPAAAGMPPPGPQRARIPLLVVGAGGHARVVVDIVEKQGRFAVVGLLDDRAGAAGQRLLGYPILGGRGQLGRADLPSHAVVAIGAAEARAAWQERLESMGFQLAVLVHPSAQVGREVELGPGTVLMAGAILNPGSRLGRGVILNTGASVDHDCDIGDFAHIAPGARLAGGVRVGARAHVGIGACVIQDIAIGAGAIVGAGAVVVRPVPPHVTVVGVPARPQALRVTPPAPVAEPVARIP